MCLNEPGSGVCLKHEQSQLLKEIQTRGVWVEAMRERKLETLGAMRIDDLRKINSHGNSFGKNSRREFGERMPAKRFWNGWIFSGGKISRIGGNSKRKQFRSPFLCLNNFCLFPEISG